MVKYSVLLILVLGFAAYCLYAVLFFAWVHTAAADPKIHVQAQQLAHVWQAGFFVSLGFAVAIVWRMVRLWRAR